MNLAKQFIEQLQKFLIRRHRTDEQEHINTLLQSFPSFEYSDLFQCSIEIDEEIDNEVYAFLRSRIEDPNKLKEIEESLINSFNYFQHNMFFALEAYEIKGHIKGLSTSNNQHTFQCSIQSLLTLLKQIPPFYRITAMINERRVQVHGFGDVFVANKTFEREIERFRNTVTGRNKNPSRTTSDTEKTMNFSPLNPSDATVQNIQQKPYKDFTSKTNNVAGTRVATPNKQRTDNQSTLHMTQDEIMDKYRQEKIDKINRGIDVSPEFKGPKGTLQGRLDALERASLNGMFLSSWND